MRTIAFGALGLIIACGSAPSAAADPSDNRRVRILVDVRVMPAYTYEVGPDNPAYGKIPGNDSLGGVEGVQCESRDGNGTRCWVNYDDNPQFFSDLQVCVTSSLRASSAIGSNGRLIPGKPYQCSGKLEDGRATLEYRVGDYASRQAPTVFYLAGDGSYIGMIASKDLWDSHSQLLAAR